MFRRNAKATFLAQNALPLSTLVPRGPHDDGYGCDGRVYQPGGASHPVDIVLNS